MPAKNAFLRASLRTSQHDHTGEQSMCDVTNSLCMYVFRSKYRLRTRFYGPLSTQVNAITPRRRRRESGT